MDNARISVGGQIVMKRKLIVPQDGNYEPYPNKIWDALESVEDVTKAFTVFKFDSHLQELLMIAEAAMRFADQESSMPQIMGGEKGSAPETVGGMVMLYNTASTVLRYRVKLYDDGITRPHIGRYYDWHMANSKKDNIKGDMEVDARGSTALLEKDIQNQTTMNLASVTSNPRYSALLDPKRELVLILKGLKVQPDDIMLSEEDIKKAQQNPVQPPEDPRVQAAKIAAETAAAELEDGKEDRAVKRARDADTSAIKREQLAYNIEREREVGARLDSEERTTNLVQSGKREMFNAEAALRVRTGQGI
jgi:hypothetical protein